MSKNYVIGFPRIGEQRELKIVLERYWSNKTTFREVQEVASNLKKRHWLYQKEAGIEFISSNDFSLYDNVLDMMITLGTIPKRFENLKDEALYFSMARGNENSNAMEMTKWFNTNYHYIVPELSKDDTYKLNATKIINEYNEAKALGIKTKINIIGPITFLAISKRIDAGDTYELFNKILKVYEALLEEISKLDSNITVQIDEPAFVLDSEAKILSLIKPAYDTLSAVSQNINIVVSTYFEHSNEASNILVNTGIWAIGLDFLHGDENIDSLDIINKSNKVLIAGVVDARNIWKNDITNTVNLLDTISKEIKKENIIISTSCSLLHTPMTLKYEDTISKEIKSWLSYACEKLDEINLISKIFFNGIENLTELEKQALALNTSSCYSRKISKLTHNKDVQHRMSYLTKFQRYGRYHERIEIQKEILKYSELPTTTIGSFPQTPEVRRARKDLKNNVITQENYEAQMKQYIDDCIKLQEECGLEVLVHGEPERNDMVEYFAQQLEGFGFSQNGWVQSYGSRCVKPPFIYGDISRPKPMTVDWITYAKSKTTHLVKGMLTGPVTILNRSFVRDDKPKDEVAKQLAVALSDEVKDLQRAGINIIQVDEAAFKEGYPLREDKIELYEQSSVHSFRLAVSTADVETQIHTHMCYSNFNNITKTIEDMDADVISIENTRSANALLKVFKEVGYKQEIGPGVYDIHSPRIPSIEEFKKQIQLLLEVLPKTQLWINPDCGLKTRNIEEVKESLTNMVNAVNIVKKQL